MPFHIAASNSRGSTTPAALVAGLRPLSVPLPGGVVLVDPVASVSRSVPPAGLNEPSPVPNVPALPTGSLYFQVVEMDAGAVHGLSFTPGRWW
jgi:hypothetical protein